MDVTLPLATDTLLISKELHLGQIAEWCKVEIDELRALNPQYKMDIIPGSSMECILRLPQQIVAPFIAAGDSIYQYKANEFFKKRRYVNISEGQANNRRTSGNTIYHKIKRGETLSTIARKYGVTVSQLRSWNQIKGSNITAGKRLRVSP